MTLTTYIFLTQVHWLLVDSGSEIQDWMKAMSSTVTPLLPQQPQPQQQQQQQPPPYEPHHQHPVPPPQPQPGYPSYQQQPQAEMNIK